MTDKIKDNAIRIAGLLGHYQSKDNIWTDKDTGCKFDAIQKFSSYNGIMPIVFECNYQQEDLDIEIVMYGSGIDVHLDDEDVLITTFDTQLGFILAIQECCIKYLEVKNGILNR